MSEENSRQIIIHGINASPGICIGKAYIVDREGVDIIKRYFISQNRVPAEINRFKTAVKKAKEEHAAIIKTLNGDFGSLLDILETHKI